MGSLPRWPAPPYSGWHVSRGTSGGDTLEGTQDPPGPGEGMDWRDNWNVESLGLVMIKTGLEGEAGAEDAHVSDSQGVVVPVLGRDITGPFGAH